MPTATISIDYPSYRSRWILRLHKIGCDDRYCKFSQAHPEDCGPNCKTTCWQYRQFPEQYGKSGNASGGIVLQPSVPMLAVRKERNEEHLPQAAHEKGVVDR
ncbi:hypothetical protein BDN72DRAFT_852786 [Pluteus cervinus]|uniref:Uncharacterized protein n=1 Tax=Pluteus cervinus TaxID=181527 RepID=A0ACD3BEK3_9AGAR|nr:hypothetical protein BDN72DRAFT_852786 [Pluteus cervinus]